MIATQVSAPCSPSRAGSSISRVFLIAAVTLSLACLAPAAAAAASAPVKITEAQFDGPPSVAVDIAGNALAVWAHEIGEPEAVRYCVLPVGAVGCAHSGELVPAGGNTVIFDVKALIDGGTYVILAEVGGGSAHTTPVEEWQSTDGGATWGLVNGGKSVVAGIKSADTGMVNPVIVPGTGVLGMAFVTAADAPSFAAFPFSAPPECSVEAPCSFANLQPGAIEHLLGNEPGQVASQAGASPGILGVFETLGKPGCASGTFDTAFYYGTGNQAASNDYNVAPGQPKSAWAAGLGPADCEVEYPAVAGGPSGFGVLEESLAGGTTTYHPFDPATKQFDTPMVTIAAEPERSPSLSQDGAGGIYATYQGGAGGPVQLAYSGDGGARWSGPNTLDGAGGAELDSAVDATGRGWAAFTIGEATYLQSFTAADSIPPPSSVMVSTTQHSGSLSGASLTLAPGSTGETDQASLAGANASSATGTVTYALYSKSSCEASSKVFSGGTVAVAAGVPAASAPVSAALAPGQYYWQASYSGNPGTVEGAKGNAPGISACGAEVLTIGTPTSTTKVVKITGSSGGTVTIEFIPGESGTWELIITVPTTASVARAGKHCKHGQVKIGHRCLPSRTVIGRAKGKGTAGSPVKVTVKLSAKVRALLRRGHTVRLTAALTYQSTFGGKPSVRTIPLTVKGKRSRHH